VSDHYVVTFDDLIKAHDEALRSGGGVVGIKDKSQLLSAIGRPYQEFGGLTPYPTVVDKAGCLLHSLLNNHGFNDASKRTAWIVCNSFLYAECYALLLPEGYPWYDRLAEMVKDAWDVEAVIEWVARFAKGYDSYDAMQKELEAYSR